MNIYGLTFSQLEDYLIASGEKITKAPFIFKGLYQQQINSFQELPNVRQSLKEQLQTDFSLSLPRLLQQSSGENTEKFLFALQDDSLIEAVLMRQKYGNSLCISSQVGCNMACNFCQSGRFKKVLQFAAARIGKSDYLRPEISASYRIQHCADGNR